MIRHSINEIYTITFSLVVNAAYVLYFRQTKIDLAFYSNIAH
jgi:hypothetical protein